MILVLILLLITAGCGWVIWHFNHQPVQVALIGFHIEARMWEVIAGSFVAGVVVWILVPAATRFWWRRRQRLRAQQQQLTAGNSPDE